LKWLGIGAFLAFSAVASGLMVAFIALAVAYPNLPDISELQDYRPKLPLRIFTADGVQIGEFGEERRQLTRIEDTPKLMKDAILAIEDARFYSHGGVDYIGVARAAVANLRRVRSQGASTITMQTARNVFLSSEQTFTRKIYEVLLSFKLEHNLTKDQILEIYMNQIFLGNRAYGFAAASEVYFGKTMRELSVAEAAMLAGIPKAPSTFNPFVNPKRARTRQLYIIERMLENGFITEAQAAAAREEPLKLRNRNGGENKVHAEYFAEAVRQLVFEQYGEDAYTRGLEVFTPLKATDQMAAYRAMRKGLLDYERRQAFRGPEKFYELTNAADQLEEAIDDILAEHPDNDEMLAAVVVEASPRKVVVVRQNAERIEITGEGLRAVASGLSASAGPNLKLRRGAVIRVVKHPSRGWETTQLPEVEGAFVALDPRSGEIRAMVGGFDWQKNKFNHVTQAWRQPGSSFKPFIYSASLERGFNGATFINDAPLFFDAGSTGSQAWEPKNYDGTFSGPMSMRRGLAKSKNMISIRILQSVGTQRAQEWVTRFGFEAEKHPPYLTMALGAGSVTPMQMALGYGVFANGGFRVNPVLISRITDHTGKVLVASKAQRLDESTRAIDERNAFLMTSLMGEITKTGTAAKAQATLKRADIYGKTGTTNDSHDAWFVGYNPSVVAAVWIGYDTPRKLGDKETGGGLSLPVWISYMEHALRGVPVKEPLPPSGVLQIGGEWYYEEFPPGNSVRGVGLGDPVPGGTEGENSDETKAPQASDTEEKKQILDLFKQ
jgi:penicillin-binding protein 1A